MEKQSKDELKREHKASVCFNDFEYDIVKKRAEEAGMTISEYIRYAVTARDAVRIR